MAESLQNQLQIICDIARLAGNEILRVYKNTHLELWKKNDGSPLTEADLLADRVISQSLQVAFPHIPIVSEESEIELSKLPRKFFLVDPLDGTKEFLQHNDEFTVNIAMVENGLVLLGVVYAPALDEMFFAAKALGAWKRKNNKLSSLRACSQSERSSIKIIGSRNHGGEQMSTWIKSLHMDYTLVVAGSSLKFCRVAEGEADIYPRFGPTSQWDTAAGQCILEVSGGAVVDIEGKPLLYGLDRPILNPHFFAVGSKNLLSLNSAH